MFNFYLFFSAYSKTARRNWYNCLNPIIKKHYLLISLLTVSKDRTCWKHPLIPSTDLDQTSKGGTEWYLCRTTVPWIRFISSLRDGDSKVLFINHRRPACIHPKFSIIFISELPLLQSSQSHYNNLNFD